MRPLAALVTLALLTPLSGCLSGGSDGEPEPTYIPQPSANETRESAYAWMREQMKGVPCPAPTVGADTSANLKLLGQFKFNRSGSASIDVHGDLLAAAANRGAVLLNFTNPLNLTYHANFTESGGLHDIKISPDNMTLLSPHGNSIDVIDMRDPTNLTLMSTYNLNDAGRPPGVSRNTHMIYTIKIKGEQWVFVAPNSNDGVWILKLVGPPEARSLEFVSQSLPVEGGPLGPHDMYVTWDVDLEKYLLYSADGFHGWAVFDVSDPAKPVPIGGLIKPEGGYTHTIQAAKIGGKRIVATIQEVGANVIEVYDATVIQAPVLLATWQASVEGTPQPTAPEHEFNIAGGKMYLGHYGNGVYIFDLTKVTTPLLGTASLRPMAHYSVGNPGGAGPTDFINVWSVDVINGVLYVSDMKTGIHIVGFGCNTPGDATLTSNG